MQSNFDFTPGLTAQFKSLRQVLCASVYGSRASLNGVASDLDVSPSELSRMLNRGIADERKLDADDIEKIIVSTGDLRAVQWMIEKFLQNPDQVRAAAAVQLAQILPVIVELAKQAGVTPISHTKRR